MNIEASSGQGKLERQGKIFSGSWEIRAKLWGLAAWIWITAQLFLYYINLS